MGLLEYIRQYLNNRAATVQQLGHPAAGVIGFEPSSLNTSGETVTEAAALNYSAVWCATRVISETVASLPCVLYRRTAGGGKERARDDPRFAMVHDAPNDEQGASTFFEAGTSHLVNWGNSYARVTRTGGNDPAALELRLPETVQIDRRDDDGVITYQISEPDEIIEWPDMLHTIGLSNDGLIGKSVVRHARQSIGSGLAQEKYAGAFFGNSAMPRGALVFPQRLDNKEAREKLRKEWNQVHQSAEGANNIAILHGGMDYKALGMNHEDAQFLESRQFSVTEISRWYRLPPHFLADLTHATFSNIEHQSLDFVKYSMLPWLKRWETSLSQKLLRPEERGELFFEFMVEGLLRADTKTRNESHAIARQWGWKSVNEIRLEENMNPVEDGDVYLQPLNMVPAGEVPETVSAEFEQNLGQSLDKIKEVASNCESYAELNQRLDDVLSGLRDERQQMRKDLDSLGQRIQVAVPEQPEVASLKAATVELLSAKLDRAVHMLGQASIKAARRQIREGTAFLPWLDLYCQTHKEQLAAALQRPAAAWAALENLDAKKLIESVVSVHVSHCRDTLLAAADGDPGGFEERVTEVADNWHAKIEEWVKLCLET